MRRHATRITPETRYGADLTGRSRLRRLEATGADDTFPQAARDALLGGTLGVDPITVTTEALLEVESNRSLVGPVNLYWSWADYYLNMGAAPQPLAAVDTTVDDPQVIVDNRRNASVPIAVADVSRADDPNAVASGDPGVGESMPWGLKVLAELTVKGADAPAAGHGWARVAGASATITTASGAGSPHPSGRHFTTGSFTTGQVLAPAPSAASYYLPTFFNQRPRVWTVAAYLRPTTGPFTGRWRVTFNPGGTNPVTYASDPFTVTGTGSFTRVAARVLTTNVIAGAAVAGTAYRTMRVELESLVAADVGLRFAAPQMYAGEDRGLMAGLAAATLPYGGVLVSLTYRNAANTAAQLRGVTRVDVHGDARLGGPTSIQVATAIPTLVNLGAAAGVGPLSVWAQTDAPPASVMWVTIEEVDTGAGGYLWLNEIDVQRTLDVSSRVVSWSVTRSREVEPAGTTLPIGTFEAASCTLVLDNTLDGYTDDLTRAGNAAISTNHRIELGTKITLPTGETYCLPVGVFYSDRWDDSTSSDVVTIEGVDRLGRDKDIDAGDTPVMVGTLVEDELHRIALSSFDFDTDARRFTVSSYTIPYLYPEGAAGTYLADLVKSLAAVVYVDELETLIVEQRAAIPAASVGVFNDANAVVSMSTPGVEDVVVNRVKVTGAPLVADAATTVVYELAEGAIPPIPAGGGASVIVPYSTAPAIDVVVGASAAVGFPGSAPLLFFLTPYATFARLGILNGSGSTVTLTKFELNGRPLRERPIAAERTSAASIRRFGSRSKDLAVRYAQTAAQLDAIAADVVGTFSGIDPATGGTSLADLEVVALGMPHLELGDRGTFAFPSKRIGAEYQLLAHDLAWSDKVLTSKLRARRADVTSVFAIADLSLADDGQLAAY